MKKGLLILLFAFVCLLVVGCGKDKESTLITQDNDTITNVESKQKEEKKDKFEPELHTLKCSSKSKFLNGTMEFAEEIEYDVKNFKITKVYSQLSAPKAMYTNWFAASLYPDLYDYDGKNTINLTDDEIREFTCVHRGAVEFTECTTEFKGKKAITTKTLDIDDYYKETFSDTEYEKLDADFLSRIKAKYEDGGETCTLK